MSQSQEFRITSQEQFRYFNGRLKWMAEYGRSFDEETGLTRREIVQALQAVTYADLPVRAGETAPVKMTRQEAAQRIQTIKSGSKVACYLVKMPGPMFFVSSLKVWDDLKRAMPNLSRAHVMTLGEAKSFMSLGGAEIRSLKEAAEWWASEPPPEAAPPQPTTPPPAARKEPCPLCGCPGDNDEDDVFSS